MNALLTGRGGGGGGAQAAMVGAVRWEADEPKNTPGVKVETL